MEPVNHTSAFAPARAGRQLLSLFVEASAGSSNTAERLNELLERRHDNIVFRAGFVRIVPAAHQLITHGHVPHALPRPRARQSI